MVTGVSDLDSLHHCAIAPLPLTVTEICTSENLVDQPPE